MSNNIIFNKSLAEYKKKYRNGRYKLMKYTKKEVEDYDKLANKTLKTKNYLLKGRKWWYTQEDKTYHEVPRAPRILWIRNINAGVKAATCALLGGAVAGGAGYGIYTAISNAPKPVKPFSKEDVVLDPETSQHVVVTDATTDEGGNEKINLGTKSEDEYIDTVSVTMGGEELTQGEQSEGGECSFDSVTGEIVIYKETTEKHPEQKPNVSATVENRPDVESIAVTNKEEKTEIEVGDKLNFIATCNPVLALQKVTWSVESSLNANVIDANGVLTANEAGTVVVKATAKSQSSISGKMKIVIKEKETVKITDPGEIRVGDAKNLEATTTPTGLDVTWSSSNSKILSIDETSGDYKALNTGDVTITAKIASGASDSIKISVKEEATKKVTLNCVPSTLEGITLEGAGDYKQSDKVHIRACGNDSHKFAGWYTDEGCEEPFSEAAPEFIIGGPEEDLILYAKFEEGAEQTVDVDVKSSSTDKGTVTGEGKHVKDSQSDVIITEEPKEGYEFEGWYDEDGEFISKEEILRYQGGEGIPEKQLEARFKEETPKVIFGIQIKGDESGQCIATSDKEEYEEGDSATLTATPADSYAFIGWYSDEECTQLISSSNPYSHTITSEEVEQEFIPIYAKFSITYPYLTFTQIPGTNTCTVKASGEGTMPANLVIPTKSPEGWYITGIVENGFSTSDITSVSIPEECTVIGKNAFKTDSLTTMTFKHPGGGWNVNGEAASVKTLSDPTLAATYYKQHIGDNWDKSSNDLNWTESKIKKDDAHGFDGEKTLFEVAKDATTISFSKNSSSDGALCGVADNAEIYANYNTSDKSLNVWSDKSIALNNSESEGLFQNCYNLKSISFKNVDSTGLTSCSRMFNGCSQLNSIDFEDLDTSMVTSFYSMFGDCTGLQTIDLSKLDTSKVTDMSYMFSGCLSLNAITFGNNYDTSKVTNMRYMFFECRSLTSLDLSMFNTSELLYSERMVAVNPSSSSQLKTIKLGASFTLSKIINCWYTFASLSNLTTIYSVNDLGIGSSCTDDAMFYNLPKLVGGKGTKAYANYVYNGAEYGFVDRDGQKGFLTASI